MLRITEKDFFVKEISIHSLPNNIYMQKLAVVLEARKINDDFSLC